jgi:ABC-type multidrug transport system fused ATPase/permease subunit
MTSFRFKLQSLFGVAAIFSVAYQKQHISCNAWAPPTSLVRSIYSPSTRSIGRRQDTTTSTTTLWGKKAARKGAGGGGGTKPRGQQQKQEKQSVKEARFDAATRQFIFTMVGLSKILPDKSKEILKNIHLSFYPGAKIGVVGLNGSGKVCAKNRCS